MSRIRGLTLMGLVALGAVAGSLTLTVAPAIAGTGFGLFGTFNGSENTISGGFAGPVGVAVDQSTKDVYVADQGHGVIDEFGPGPKEEWLSQLEVPNGTGGLYQLAVDGSGNVYVANISTGELDKFNSAGVLQGGNFPLTGLNEPTGVAVDSTGNLFVASYGAGTVSEYSSAGAVVHASLITGLSEPFALAVDAAGDIYVGSSAGTNEYTAAGVCVEVEAGVCAPAISGGGRGVAVDGSGDVFVSEGSVVSEYGATSEHKHLATFGAFSFAFGIGVEDATQTVYVGDNGANDVSIFNQGPLPEMPVTKAAAGVRSTTAVLHGEVNPGAATEKLDYSFAYGTTGSCEGVATTTPVEAEGNHEEVSAEATGLEPSKLYTFCVIAINKYSGASGVVGGPLTFETPALSLPGASTAAAAGVAENLATLSGTVTSAGSETTYHFAYLPQATYEEDLAHGVARPLSLGKRTPESENVGTDYLTHPAGPEEVRELLPGTVYHYAIVATNKVGTTIGPEQTFTTTGTPPVEPGPQAEIPGPAPQASPFGAATVIPFAPYTSIAALDAKEAKEGKGSTPVTKSLTRAEKLAKALKACKKQPKGKRAGCQKQARAKYGPVGTKKKKKK